MARKAQGITVTEAEREQLKKLANGQKTERRMVDRAGIILKCAEGEQISDIAEEFNIRPNTVIKWRDRFKERRLSGLEDARREGRPNRYGTEFLRQVLAVIDREPPTGSTQIPSPIVTRWRPCQLAHPNLACRARGC